MIVLGLDIGGANLKAADSDGRAVTRPFAVWKQPERLREAINGLADQIVNLHFQKNRAAYNAGGGAPIGLRFVVTAV